MAKRRQTKEVTAIGAVTTAKRLRSVNHTRVSTLLTARQHKNPQRDPDSRTVQRHLEGRQRYSGELQVYAGNASNPNVTVEREDPNLDHRSFEDDDHNQEDHEEDDEESDEDFQDTIEDDDDPFDNVSHNDRMRIAKHAKVIAQSGGLKNIHRRVSHPNLSCL